MKKGAPYIAFACVLREFLRSNNYASPGELHRDLKLMMGRYAPSASSVWMSFYGERLLPLEAILYMQQRLGFKCVWSETLSTESPSGASLSSNQLALPGMRELKSIQESVRRAKR